MSVITRDQKSAQSAFHAVERRVGNGWDDYVRFARRFPALLQECGLCQTIAFADSKGYVEFIVDVATVMASASANPDFGADALRRASREANLVDYLRLNRDAMSAANWIKRYVDAFESAS